MTNLQQRQINHRGRTDLWTEDSTLGRTKQLPRDTSQLTVEFNWKLGRYRPLSTTAVLMHSPPQHAGKPNQRQPPQQTQLRRRLFIGIIIQVGCIIVVVHEPQTIWNCILYCSGACLPVCDWYTRHTVGCRHCLTRMKKALTTFLFVPPSSLSLCAVQKLDIFHF